MADAPSASQQGVAEVASASQQEGAEDEIEGSDVEKNNQQGSEVSETVEKNIRKLLYRGTLANFFFLLASANFMAFGVLEFQGRARTNPGSGTYITSFICFLLNGAVELYIDLFLQRTLRPVSYTHLRAHET